MNTVKLVLAEARGRNGWFRAREAMVASNNWRWPLNGPDMEIPAPYIALEVDSGKRQPTASPVILNMSREDAHRLGMALLAAVAGEVLVCIQKQDMKDSYDYEFEGYRDPSCAFDALVPELQEAFMTAAREAIGSIDWQEKAVDAFYTEREAQNMDLVSPPIDAQG